MECSCRNVNDGFHTLVNHFHYTGSRRGDEKGRWGVWEEESRNGPVYRTGPALVTFTSPRERVLFNGARDPNPFFHLYEALWMLAGREDVAPLAYFNKRMATFSDDGTTLNGAYGKRWRDWKPRNYADTYDIDQVEEVINHLKKTPTTRRAVLQMWDPERDLLKVDTSKDVCCNVCVMFDPDGDALNMTVVNRSNDLIWGLLGANYVHFSFLQEYVALSVGARVGTYTQFSNNLHAYQWNWEPDKWLAWYKNDGIPAERPWAYYPTEDYEGPLPLFKNRKNFDEEIKRLIGMDPSKGFFGEPILDLEEKFLADVAVPMFNTFFFYKTWKQSQATVDRKDLQFWFQAIRQPDWAEGARIWLDNRGITV